MTDDSFKMKRKEKKTVYINVDIRTIFFSTIQNLVSVRHNMVDTKRKLTFDESSEEKNSKKLRKDEFNRIENLSNEMFFEIFYK